MELGSIIFLLSVAKNETLFHYFFRWVVCQEWWPFIL